MTSEQNEPAVLGPVERQVRALVPCALCGADKGYTLADGTTCRWWYVSCAACGEEVGECAADRGQRDYPLPTRWAHADDHWDRVGAHAERLREALRRLRAWGGLGKRSYSATVAFGVTDWIDAGMLGELPELPEYAVRPNI